jgi:hypothetical protein
MSNLSRNAFLVTTSGWVLGNVSLPEMSPAQLAARKRLFTIPSTEPNSFVAWLELSADGACRPMVFMALSEGDRRMIARLTEALRLKDFRLERLREAPHQDGEFVVRLVVAGTVKFLTTGDEHVLFAEEGEGKEIFADDPAQGALFTYARALLVAVRMMREMQAHSDSVVYLEPVLREAAVAKPDDVGVVFVDYLPTIDPNQPGQMGPGVPAGGRAATVYMVSNRESD